MAVRAVEEAPGPPFADAGNLRQFIDGAGSHENATAAERLAAGQPYREASLDVEHLIREQLHAVCGVLPLETTGATTTTAS